MGMLTYNYVIIITVSARVASEVMQSCDTS